MIKNLFTLATALVTILALASCSSKSRNNAEVETETVVEEVEVFETIENEEEAAVVDTQTQEEIEEVEVQDRVFFGYDSAELNDAAKEILEVQIAWLKNDTAISVTIEGHCDERGTREYNIALGDKRANAVQAHLIENGIDASRVKTISYGKERPAFFGASEGIMAKNRRSVTVVN